MYVCMYVCMCVCVCARVRVGVHACMPRTCHARHAFFMSVSAKKRFPFYFVLPMLRLPSPHLFNVGSVTTRGSAACEKRFPFCAGALAPASFQH